MSLTDLRTLHLAVLMGGPGSEREVSLRSGAAVAKALRVAGYRVSEVDVRGPEFILPEDTGHPEADIRRAVEQITAFLEAQVRAHPGQWFWQHRRWPKEAWRDAGVR